MPGDPRAYAVSDTAAEARDGRTQRLVTTTSGAVMDMSQRRSGAKSGSRIVGHQAAPAGTSAVRLSMAFKRPRAFGSMQGIAQAAQAAGAPRPDAVLPGMTQVHVSSSHAAAPAQTLSRALSTQEVREMEAALRLFEPQSRLLVTKAAVRIQASFRGSLGKRMFSNERCSRSATKIQAVFRGRKARKIVGFSGAFVKLRSGGGAPAFQYESRQQRLRTMSFKSSAVATSNSEQAVHFIAADQIMDFTMSQGTQGSLAFEGASKRSLLDPTAGSLRAAQQAKFVRMNVPAGSSKPFGALNKAEKKERVQFLKGLAEFIKHGWGVQMPSVIFDVTGGAQPFELRPIFLELFKSSFLKATRDTNSWVVTGGTDAGIMRLVGDALATVQSAETTLGVLPYGSVYGRSSLQESRKLPANCTVRVDGVGTEFAIWLQQNQASLTDLLQDTFSKYGPVIGVTYLRCYPRTPKHPRGLVERVRTGEQQDPTRLDGQWKYFGFVSFANAMSAQAAVVEQRISYQGRSVGLNTTIVKTAEQRHGSDPKSKASVDDNDALRKRGLAIHVEEVLSSRGSTAWPYVYSGKRDVYREGPIGTQLNPNHSHYLLFDAGEESTFGSEISLRSELLDFISYRRDVETVDLDELTRMVNEKIGDRGVPVITFVFGGGPGTIQTAMESMANNNPIIVAAGSGRCADLIAEWTDMYKQMQELLDRAGPESSPPWHLIERQNALARAWILQSGLSNLSKKDAQKMTREMHVHLEADVEKTRAALDVFAKYPQLYFFQVGDKADSETNDLLSVVLHAIFDSPSIKHSIKLPLAIRYDNIGYVRKTMQRQGSKRLPVGEEITIDARLSVFAAFHDQAEVFMGLQDWGFDGDQLDQLILLELHQMAEMQLLSKAKTLEPPLTWIKKARHTSRLTPEEQAAWIALSTKEQVTQLRQKWREQSLDKQRQIVADDIQRVGWDKLPWLTGWTYRAVHYLGQVRKEPGKRAQKYLGKDFVLQKVTRNPDGTIVVEVVGLDGVARRGTVLTSADAEKLVQENLDEGTDDSWRDCFTLGSNQWIALYDPTVNMEQMSMKANILLQQHCFDAVGSGLRIEEPGWWTPKKQKGTQRAMSKELIKNVWKSFQPWLDVDNVKVGVPWWRTARPATAEQVAGGLHQELYSAPLDPLHRIFWAVMTSRNRLAEALWSQLPPQGAFAGAFLCSFSIRHAVVSNPLVAATRSTAWSSKTIRFLNELQNVADPDCIRAIFDEYLYFGLEEEKYARQHPHQTTRYGALSLEEQMSNAKRRSSLILMGCDVEFPKTRVDLAILAGSKLFLGHPSTEHFMDTLWAQPCSSASTGKYSEYLLEDTPFNVLSSPRMKFWSNTLGYISFVCLYATVYLDTPDAHQPSLLGGVGLHVPTQMSTPSSFEIVFWLWSFSMLINEMNQIRSDFDSVAEYLSASGNLLDATIQAVFTIAFIGRFLSYQLFRYDGISASEGVDGCQRKYPACELYLITLGLLGFNFICCCYRVLMSLNIFQNVGVLLIIVLRILLNDVAPFMVVLLTFLWCFTVTGYFFFLATDQSASWKRMGFDYVRTWLDPGNMPNLMDALDEEAYLRSRFENTYAFPNAVHSMYMFAFFVLTSIILTNLLIAMMSDRFAKVTADATAEWRVAFSGQVREYSEATILPLPFNVLEIMVNVYKRSELRRIMYHFADKDDGATVVGPPSWGRHHTWPKPASRFDLHFVINRDQITAEAKTEELQRLTEIQSMMVQKASKQAELAQMKRNDSLNNSGSDISDSSRCIPVIISDKNLIDTRSPALAKELGVAGMWKPGAEHSFTGPGVSIVVTGIPNDHPLEAEAGLTKRFSRYGSVLAVTIRTFRKKEGRLSWALLSFVSKQAADLAIKQAPSEMGVPSLVVSYVDADQALASTGAMGMMMRKQFAKAEASSVRGEILCETPGASDAIGERCVAVRMLYDGRVLLVRSGGVEPDHARNWTAEQQLIMALDDEKEGSGPSESKDLSVLAGGGGGGGGSDGPSLSTGGTAVAVAAASAATTTPIATLPPDDDDETTSAIAGGGSWSDKGQTVTPGMLQNTSLRTAIMSALFVRRLGAKHDDSAVLDGHVASVQHAGSHSGSGSGSDSEEENERTLRSFLESDGDGSSDGGGDGGGAGSRSSSAGIIKEIVQ